MGALTYNIALAQFFCELHQINVYFVGFWVINHYPFCVLVY
jgi:hypothetical protein